VDFVLALHSHLPFVLHHGRWPHGSVWLSEAALDTYLPLIEALQRFERDGIPAPVTLGITPVLANQLSHPSFVSEFEAYMEQRIETSTRAPASLVETDDAALVPVAEFWQQRLARLLDLFRRLDGDLLGEFRALESRGRLELISSAATHGFLPLLERDESIKLQVGVGASEHRRLFGRAPAGFWLPECAYRPAGPWAPPGARPSPHRAGIDTHISAAGFRYFFVDAHIVDAGHALGYPYGSSAVTPMTRSPHVAYRVGTPGATRRDLFALPRDPASSSQVWSRAQGYPGDEWYLEFHKIRWPDGLRLWRVTGPQVDLARKAQYDPPAAQRAVDTHAAHFVDLLHQTAGKGGNVVAAPFDAELFGHWWFEGVDFLSGVYQRLATNGIRPVTAETHLAAAASRPQPAVELAPGSWGKDGDFSMWLNAKTDWIWRRLWALEESFWGVARHARADPARRETLAQAAREMLLAQSSDWPFIISTGEAADYAEQRFDDHCGNAEALVKALAGVEIDDETRARVKTLATKNALFPDVLRTVEEVLA
jgi:1,4-alpha-glucan branching enzyme